MITPDQQSQVADLIKRSREAEAGAKIAKDCRNTSEMQRLITKAEDLLEEAWAIDPDSSSPAWKA